MIPMFSVAAALHADVGSAVRVLAALLTIAASAGAVRFIAVVADADSKRGAVPRPSAQARARASIEPLAVAVGEPAAKVG
jgi:hypothetical protein